MKNKLPVFIGGILVGIVVTLVLIGFVLPGKMFIVNESKLGFAETLETIEESVTDNGWSIPHQYNLQATMQKNGFQVEPARVFSLCNPSNAHEILKGGERRMVSALMPCRVAVYEKDGKTFVSMLNARLFSKFLGKEVSSVMNAATKENLMILEPVIKN